MSRSKRLTQIRAGRLVTAVLYTQATAADEPHVRQAKQKISSEARKRLNHKASWEKLEQLSAANFDKNDLFVTLTYRDIDLPHSREQALRCLNDFLRQLRDARQIRGEELLYIKCAEHLRDDGTEGRWHHHIQMNATGSDYEELRALWAKYGDDVDIQPLLDSGWDYEGRARYMCKERPPAGKQAWTPSRNLKRPERSSEMVDDALTLTAPPGAVVIDCPPPVSNNWGSYAYIKYLLPYRPPKPERRRRMPRRSE